jgi:hypothetical protein
VKFSFGYDHLFHEECDSSVCLSPLKCMCLFLLWASLFPVNRQTEQEYHFLSNTIDGQGVLFQSCYFNLSFYCLILTDTSYYFFYQKQAKTLNLILLTHYSLLNRYRVLRNRCHDPLVDQKKPTSAQDKLGCDQHKTRPRWKLHSSRSEISKFGTQFSCLSRFCT